MQKTFKQFLLSQPKILTEGKNLHMQHAEDAIVDQGYPGALNSIKQLEYIAGLLKGGADSKVKITTKYDIAIIFLLIEILTCFILVILTALFKI